MALGSSGPTPVWGRLVPTLVTWLALGQYSMLKCKGLSVGWCGALLLLGGAWEGWCALGLKQTTFSWARGCCSLGLGCIYTPASLCSSTPLLRQLAGSVGVPWCITALDPKLSRPGVYIYVCKMEMKTTHHQEQSKHPEVLRPVDDMRYDGTDRVTIQSVKG